MLDDEQYIKQRDPQGALSVVSNQPKQLAHSFKFENSDLKKNDCKNIVVAGMGGSALAATIIHVWPGLNIPLEVVRDYTLPDYVDAHTLVIASSYSGNTEETVSCLEEAGKLSAQIAVIAAGGKLAEAAAANKYPLMRIPDGLQPRMAVFYNLAALIQLLELSGLARKGSVNELRLAGQWLGEQTASWLPTSPTTNNQAKQIAQELMGKSVVIYGGPKLFPAAYKWKINFNENAKHIAWCNQLPEFNHNEFMGWTEQPVQKPYGVIDLRSNLEHPRVQKRFEVTEQLLSGKRPKPIVVQAEGKTILQQLLWTIALGDFVSIYLALLNNINPTPVDLIEKFKKSLD
ncbi:MAG TPA: bifunctional phosphoglucose/phosphomannose isomerase [Patescibacteria group bacterium]|nr:bifunctional phosphoglucose/phosphomannose isomerase [Patescibacteria group bacterium]